jgi:hypothetical protein
MRICVLSYVLGIRHLLFLAMSVNETAATTMASSAAESQLVATMKTTLLAGGWWHTIKTQVDAVQAALFCGQAAPRREKRAGGFVFLDLHKPVAHQVFVAFAVVPAMNGRDKAAK